MTTIEPIEIRGGVELPARREEVELHTADGLTLVGELALPLDREPIATIVALHPLPTAGGFMDSHILRKAAGRLPAAGASGPAASRSMPSANPARTLPPFLFPRSIAPFSKDWTMRIRTSMPSSA